MDQVHSEATALAFRAKESVFFLPLKCNITGIECGPFRLNKDIMQIGQNVCDVSGSTIHESQNKLTPEIWGVAEYYDKVDQREK